MFLSKRLYPIVILKLFLKNFFAEKVCTACCRTSFKIVPLTNLSKYLYNDKSEIKVNININDNSEKFLKKASRLSVS